MAEVCHRMVAHKPMLSQTDYALLAQQAAMQKAQAVLVQQHDRAAPDDKLLLGSISNPDIHQDKPLEWPLTIDVAALYTSLGLDTVTLPRTRLRIATDGFLTAAHCQALKGAADSAMAGVPERNGLSNVAVGAVGAVAAQQRREGKAGMLDCHGDVLSRMLIFKTRLLLMEKYGEPELYESGSVITRLRPAAQGGARGGLPYACRHVDKANIASYDYSALLYLSDFGTDFRGGEFVFCDQDANRIVEPRMGRLVAFASGPENLHQVRTVTAGGRYVLAMWFTRNRELGLEVYNGAQPSTASPTNIIQVSTLGRQMEVQNVLTAMRRDFDEVLAGIRASNFASTSPHHNTDTDGENIPVLGVLRRCHEQPPIEDMCRLLEVTVDVDAARDVLFFPREEHMRHYVSVLGKMGLAGEVQDTSAESSGAANVRALFLNMLVLWHSRHWVLARAFMMYGGLDALVSLQAPGLDAQIRWSSIQVFSRLLIEHPDGWEFDWMDPLDTESPMHQSHPEYPLHCALARFASQSPCTLLSALLLSPPPAACGPEGGKLLCLRLVAFWLSWLRALYCPRKPQDFRLKQVYLDKLLALSQMQRGDAGNETATDGERRRLAQQLHGDFARFPPADDGSDIMGLRLPAETVSPSHPSAPPSTAAEFKEKGIAAFAAKNFAEAETMFSQAILADHTQEAYFANRSSARLALGMFQEALSDCEVCLDMSEQRNVKAWYRKGQALQQLNRLADAKVAFEAGLKLLPSSSQLKQALDQLETADKPGTSGSIAPGQGHATSTSDVASKSWEYSVDATKDTLIVCVKLGRDSMQGVNLQMQRSSFTLEALPMPPLVVKFPSEVDDEQVKAKLVKRSGVLKIVAPFASRQRSVPLG